MSKEAKIINERFLAQEQLKELDIFYGIGIGESSKRMILAQKIISNDVIPVKKTTKNV